MKATSPASPAGSLAVMAVIAVLSHFGVYVLSGKGPRYIGWIPEPVGSLFFLVSILFGLVTPLLVVRLLLFSKVLFGKGSGLLKGALVITCLLALVPSVIYYGMIFKVFTGRI